MRTTLSLDDDVFASVKSYAKNRSLGLGKAVSDLVRKGLRARLPTRMEDGFLVFDTPPDSPPVTSERVKELESKIE